MAAVAGRGGVTGGTERAGVGCPRVPTFAAAAVITAAAAAADDDHMAATLTDTLLLITSDEQSPIPTELLFEIVDTCTDPEDASCIEVREPLRNKPTAGEWLMRFPLPHDR